MGLDGNWFQRKHGNHRGRPGDLYSHAAAPLGQSGTATLGKSCLELLRTQLWRSIAI
jgi:hypothetical protein